MDRQMYTAAASESSWCEGKAVEYSVGPEWFSAYYDKECDVKADEVVEVSSIGWPDWANDVHLRRDSNGCVYAVAYRLG